MTGATAKGMVAMASDSYLLKAPQPPCQGQGCRNAKDRSASCGVVLALVLLLATVLGLAGVVYYLRLELCAARADILILEARVRAMDGKLDRLNLIEQLRTFENGPPQRPGAEVDTDEDFEEDDDEDDDDVDPVYPDEEDGNILENRAQDSHKEGAVVVPQLHPAGSLVNGAASTVADGTDQDGKERRRRREVPAASGGNRGHADPHLRLYHMLQNPGLAAVPPPPEDTWSLHGARREGRPQPMYAEQAPMGYVTPPGLRVTSPAPIASRRSRVMDAGHRQQHRGRSSRRQRLQQHAEAPPLDVAQNVLQEGAAARSVEVGRRRPAEQRVSWRGSWRGPWRAVRVTDNFHH